MMKRWQAVKRLLPLLAMFSLLLSGCGREDLSALNPQGPVAQGQLGLIKLSISIMTLVIVVVLVIGVYVLIRFRRKKGQNEIPEQVEGNHKLEIIWTTIPLVLVILLAVPTIQQIFANGDGPKDWKSKNTLQVKVTGHQFWWEFEYPQYDGLKTAQELVVPADKDFTLELKTADVLHSFWVPSLAGKMDTNTEGTINYMTLSAPAGTYIGKCAELCGPSHGYMEFRVKAVDAAEFDQWVEANKAPAVLPEDPQLAEKFKNQCLTCHAVGDQGGFSGPNLTGIGSRETIAGILLNDINGAKGSKPTKDNLVEWLQNPQEVKPGNKMPDPKKLGFTDEEIDQIADYLANYKFETK